jgi:hypothetical protein
MAARTCKARERGTSQENSRRIEKGGVRDDQVASVLGQVLQQHLRGRRLYERQR